MDRKTKELIESKGLFGGIWAYVTAPPDNERITAADRIVTFVSRIVMFFILAGVFVTFYEVVMRYLFGSPTIWVNEMVLWLGSIIYLASGAYTMQRRAHIRITAVYDIVSRNMRLFFDYVAIFVLVVYAMFMLVGAYDVAWEAFITWERFGTIFDPPIPATVKPLVLIVTLAVAGLALNNMLIDWYGYGKKQDDADSDANSKAEEDQS